MNANLDRIDSLLRLIDREVWVITAAAGSRRGGLTATWVSQASIDRERPVILAGLAPNHYTTELVKAGGGFVAHLLTLQHAPIAWNFASGSGRERDKFSGLATHASASGGPVLADCLAWFDCRVFATYDGGDRMLFWADVVAAEQPGSGLPLCEKELIESLSRDQREQLAADRDADIELQRPRHEFWRQRQ